MLSQYFSARGIAQEALPHGGTVPLRFSNPLQEHLAARRGVGLFDFSFMGWWAFTGRDALGCLQRLQTRDLRLLQPGRICYTLLCREDGSVFIDATVWCHHPEHYWLFTGRRTDFAHVERCAQHFDVEIASFDGTHSVVAIQGPASAALLQQTLPGSAGGIRHFAFRRCMIEGADAWIGRLGYTGELGYELLVPMQHAVDTWTRLLDAPLLAPRLECGIEAVNSLRIEAGFIHFAYELAQRVMPAELGLSRLVRAGGDPFIGRDALLGATTRARRITGVKLSPSSAMPKATPRDARMVVDLTSEAFSPLFGGVLGLAYADQNANPGSVAYTSDGRRAELSRLPFRDPMRRLSRQDVPFR
jgi:aminomethyltransferase